MTTRFRPALFAAALLLASGALAQDKVVFATNWKAQAAHGGFYQAVADGTYRKYGLDVTIQPGGPQSGQHAGQEHGHCKQCRRSAERRDIDASDTEDLRLNEESGHDRRNAAENGTDHRDAEGLAQDHCDDLIGPRTHCHPNSDLPRSCRDAIGSHSVKADAGEQ